jgi:endonuclease/exonuclease/phosphatase family metal-dependent hydrolase
LSRRLRVGTFNARFLPYLMGTRRRARRLAQSILEYDYDLIALSEVFAERARSVLLEHLAQAYPFNVQYVGSRRRLRIDSGLMLLSKLPFTPLPEPDSYRPNALRAIASGVTPDWSHVWFVEYDDCCCSDCLAGKGAGYLRVSLYGRPLHVFFTHMQAKYDWHSARKHERTRNIRFAQIGQLTTLIRAALGDRLADENVLILGDLNVDGGRTATGDRDAETGEHDEWAAMLDTLERVFPHGIDDVWDRYAPVAQRGDSYPAWRPHARRDYVLLSAPDPEQSIRVTDVSMAHNLARPSAGRRHAGSAKGHLSDHLGINVELRVD